MKFENTKVFGIENALIGMRLPMSKDFLDARTKSQVIETKNAETYIGTDDLRVAKNLIKADKQSSSQPNSKFLRMIHVQTCITAPQIFWAEFDTYKVGVTRNSSSLQHTGSKRDFIADDFDINIDVESSIEFNQLLEKINELRRTYLDIKNYEYFIAMRSIIPMSYKYTCMVDLDYATLRNIYHWRKNHKLRYWHEFCDWIKTLPYSNEFIIGE